MGSESMPSAHDPTLVGTEESGSSAGSTRDSAAAPSLSRGDTIGRYLLVQTIGRGASGVVWMAYDADLDRRVAIKLLGQRASERGDRRRAQLAEAQAMAKIRHPNVVAVYDVGTHEDRLYIAMELIDGQTLGRWCSESGRTQSDILDAYTDAARGLAAAHSAGLVHRDFKPDNVLVDRDGRVRVADFGLAAAVDEVTRTGNMVSGTPAYMSPEHHAGNVDAKSDQFSFCVALCEALTGQRPFVGATLAELAAATVDATIDPRALALLPARVRSVVVRGLAPLPADRHASMDALALALGHARRPRWPWVVGLGAIAGAVGVTWMLAGPAPETPACSAGTDRIERVWTTKSRAAIHIAPGHYTPQYAADVAQHLGVQLDDYATRWAAVHDRVCTATQSAGTTAAPTDVARRSCVEDRFAAFAGTTALVTTRELDVDSIEPLLAALPDPAECERDDIAAWEPVPADPELATQVADIRRRLHDLSLRFATGDVAEANATAYATLAEARATGYTHLVASALTVVAGFDDTLGRTELARQHLDEATELALRAGHDWLVATIAVERLEHRSRYPSDDRGGDEWGLLARALIARSGGDDRLVGRLRSAQAGIAFNRGDFAAALAHQREAIAAFERLVPAVPRILGAAYLEAAVACAQLNRPEDAAEYARTGQRLFAESGEPRARDLVRALHLFALLESTLGRPRDALAHFEHALAEAQQTYGTKSRMTSIIAFNHAFALADSGRIEDARARLALSRDAWAAADDEYSAAEFEMAEYAIDMFAGDVAGALVHVDRAIELWSANMHANERPLANAHRSRADALLALGDNDAVLAMLEPLYRRWGPELFVSPESVLDPVVAAYAKRDDDALALWLARSEALLDHEGGGLHTFIRAHASRRPDAATVQSVRDLRERWAATHFDGHPHVRQMDAWLVASTSRP